MRLQRPAEFGARGLLALVCLTFALDGGPLSAQTAGSTGWNVIYDKEKPECVVGRKMDGLTVFFEPDFDGRNAISLLRKDWAFTRAMEPARVELVGRGTITLPGLHNGSSLVLVFPEKESDNARILLDALGGTQELRVTSDQLPEGHSVAVAIDGFAEMLEELSKCERYAQLQQEKAQLDQDKAQLEQERAQVVQSMCAAALGQATWLTALTSNYDVEQRSDIEKLADTFEDTCAQPDVAGAIRAAMLDQDYHRAGTLTAAACDIGQISGCHFGALISAYGNNPHIAPGEGQRRMQGLCDDGFALSCEVIEAWADR